MKSKRMLYVLAIVFVLCISIVNVKADENIENKNHKNGKHYTCLYFIDEYSNKQVSSSCAPEGTKGKKTYTYPKTNITNQGDVYEIDGWYDKDGNKVSNNSKISVSYEASTENCEDIYYYLKWNVKKAPILNFKYVDRVSTGSGSWSNTNGSTSVFKHTFKEPEQQPHFKFIEWKIDSDAYKPQDIYVYDFKDKGYNTIDNVTAYAWWQSSITVNLYDDNELLDQREDFIKVSIDDYKPIKEGYEFLGWKDENDNDVTDTDFYPLEKSIDKVNPKVVNLYAKWKKNDDIVNVSKIEDTNQKGSESHNKIEVKNIEITPPNTLVDGKTDSNISMYIILSIIASLRILKLVI